MASWHRLLRLAWPWTISIRDEDAFDQRRDQARLAGALVSADTDSHWRVGLSLDVSLGEGEESIPVAMLVLAG